MNRRLHFLGLDVDTGQPFFTGLNSHGLPNSRLSLAAQPRPLRYGVDSRFLATAGWGIVFCPGVDPAIKRALRPLIERRRQQAGKLFKELTYKVRRSAGSFLSSLRAGPGPVDPNRVPYYLLLIGHPRELPYGFEIELGCQHAVGRLAFHQPAAYESYVRALLSAESEQLHRGAAIKLFAPSHPHDEATRACRRQLIDPLRQALRQRRPNLLRRSFLGRHASRGQLVKVLADRATNLVLVAGHASMIRTDADRQRARQGSLVCSDWPGHGTRVLPEHTVGADALSAAADLSGTVFVLFGCFTAGTPSHDSFSHLDRDPGRRRRLTEHPFVARLPQALLSHRPGAALAVIGHVDRAWPSSFEWQGIAQANAFEDFLLAAADGRRIGFAMQGFKQRYVDLARRLATATHRPGDSTELDLPAPRELWLAYNDARSFVLLGDPAARLSISAATAGERAMRNPTSE